MTKDVKKQLEEAMPLKEGDTIEATVLTRAGKKLVFDIEGRALGVVPPREMSAEADELKKGDKVLAYILQLENEDGDMILSLRRSDREKIWETLAQKQTSDEILLVKAIEANKGGLMVESGGVRGFLPVSQLSQEHYPRVEGGDKNKILEKLRSYINKNFSVKIISLEPENNKLILSEKKVNEGQQTTAISSLKIGDKIKGNITGIADFGIFVRFNYGKNNEQVDGLVHISEISWEKVTNIKKSYRVGQEVEAEILSTDNNRVSLSIKRLESDPWAKEIEKFKEGDIVKGAISKITPFGAFVKISDKIEGLLHISEISDEKITDPHDAIEQDKKYDLKIISIEPDSHRLALSLKRVNEKKKTLKDLKISDKILKKLEKAGFKKIEKLLSLSEEDLEKAKLTKKEIEELVKKIQ